MIAWLPPTGIGQPTECARVASIIPAPAAVNDGIREMIWAATPVNRARASSPVSEPHAGVPWASIRTPSRHADGTEFGTDRLSPSSRATTSSERSTSGPSRRRNEAPPSNSAQVRSRSRYAMAAGRPGNGLAYEISGTANCTPRAGRSNSMKNGDASANGCTAEQMSCTTPAESGSVAVRAPPPNVG